MLVLNTVLLRLKNERRLNERLVVTEGLDFKVLRNEVVDFGQIDWQLSFLGLDVRFDDIRSDCA